MRIEAVVLAALLALSASAVGAQEEPAPEPEVAEVVLTEEESDQPSPVLAAGWCVFADREPEEAGDNEAEEEPGCDVGVGLALLRHRRLAWVAVLGAETLGTGVAWLVPQPGRRGPVVAIALGIVTRYDSAGIHRTIYPALGATLSFGRGAK